MSIKIPSGPVESKALDAAQDAAESIEGASKAAQAKGIESADTEATAKASTGRRASGGSLGCAAFATQSERSRSGLGGFAG